MPLSTKLFSVDGSRAVPAVRSSLQQQKLTETGDLERWVVDNPEILGDRVMIVTTQFDRWESSGGDTARERLDILALDGTGQLIVVELKRGSDRRVHLQAITYAALVASFTKQTLARAHAAYLERLRPEGETGVVPEEDALRKLSAHVEAGDDPWDDDLLTQPKIVLIAEDFPSQVLTTVQWLTGLTEGRLEIELQTVSVFAREGDSHELSVVFQKEFPLEDLEARMLVAGAGLPSATASEDAVRDKIGERKRRQRSAAIIVDNTLIPADATVEFRLRTYAQPAVCDRVEQWIGEDPRRGQAAWTADRNRPLRWRATEDDPEAPTWSLTKLGEHIIAEATGQSLVFSGGDTWFYQGANLYTIARNFGEGDGL